MECGHTLGIDRHKRQADRTLLFEYICSYMVILSKSDAYYLNAKTSSKVVSCKTKIFRQCQRTVSSIISQTCYRIEETELTNK